MSDMILAIDLGKYECYLLVRPDPTTKVTEFRTVRTSPELFEAEILRQPVVTVVIEACSPAG